MKHEKFHISQVLSIIKVSIYSDITNRLIDKMQESGALIWFKPWRSVAPVNGASNRKYSGINKLILSTSGFADPRWFTYRQCSDLGGYVKKGEKGLPIVFWKASDEEERLLGKPKFISRTFFVFNSEQCIGLNLPEIATPTFNADALKAIDKLILGFGDAPPIKWGAEQAYYSPKLDVVAIPHKLAFVSSEACFATLAHELSHATGHSSRLNRTSITEPISFGSEVYSQEELLSEISAAFLCGEFGIQNTITQSAAYVQGWLSALKNDPTMIVKAACQAQKSADWILGRSSEQSVEEAA